MKKGRKYQLIWYYKALVGRLGKLIGSYYVEEPEDFCITKAPIIFCKKLLIEK